jgi:hypothetical protein
MAYVRLTNGWLNRAGGTVTNPRFADWDIFTPTRRDLIMWRAGPNTLDAVAFVEKTATERKFNFTLAGRSLGKALLGIKLPPPAQVGTAGTTVAITGAGASAFGLSGLSPRLEISSASG